MKVGHPTLTVCINKVWMCVYTHIQLYNWADISGSVRKKEKKIMFKKLQFSFLLFLYRNTEVNIYILKISILPGKHFCPPKKNWIKKNLENSFYFFSPLVYYFTCLIMDKLDTAFFILSLIFLGSNPFLIPRLVGEKTFHFFFFLYFSSIFAKSHYLAEALCHPSLVLHFQSCCICSSHLGVTVLADLEGARLAKFALCSAKTTCNCRKATFVHLTLLIVPKSDERWYWC